MQLMPKSKWDKCTFGLNDSLPTFVIFSEKQLEIVPVSQWFTTDIPQCHGGQVQKTFQVQMPTVGLFDVEIYLLDSVQSTSLCMSTHVKLKHIVSCFAVEFRL